ncbi:MAG: PKD domain-containing protein [Solirubrobacteraceae bacterium]
MRLKAVLALIGAACIVAAITSGASGAVSPPPCQPGPGPVGGGGVEIQVPATHKLVWCSPTGIGQNLDIKNQVSYTICGRFGLSCSTRDLGPAISIRHLFEIAHVRGVQLTDVIHATSPSILDKGVGSSNTQGVGPIVVAGPPTEYYGPEGSGQSWGKISPADGSPIELLAIKTQPLTVSVTAGAAGTVAPGTRVSVSASPANGSYRYRFSFGDGSGFGPTSKSTVTHVYSRKGTFDVYATVVTPDGAGGASLIPAQVIVGKIPPKNLVSPPNINSKKNNPPATGTTPTATYPTYPSYTNPPATTNTGTQRQRARSRSPASASHGPGQKVVEGRLISNVTPVTPAALASGNGGAGITTSQPKTQSTTLVERALPPAAGLAVAGAILLLLGSGAGRELRSLRRSVASARLA